MELSKTKAFLIFFIISIAPISAKIELKELITKQSLNNLRFISNNGKFTYYQRRSGSLLLSTNYNVKEVLKGKIGTQYQLISSPSMKRILITVDQTFHSFLGVRKLLDIYQISYGGTTATKIGSGIAPKLHLNDTWVSFYNPYTKVLKFNNLENGELSYSIKLRNKKNLYFIPERIMLSRTSALYTDISSSGQPGIVRYDSIKDRINIVYKGDSISQKIELCKGQDKVFWGNFSLDQNYKYSSISLTNLENFDFEKFTTIYQSNSYDIGNIICNISRTDIFFLRTLIGDKTKSDSSDVYKINILTKKQKQMSNILYATKILNMDQTLLLPFRGKVYMLLGNDSVESSDNLLKEKSDNEELKK